MLDRQARAEYRRRLRDLRETLEEAEALHDVGRVEAVREEMGFLERHLASSCGLGGRVRRGVTTTERVRLAVTKRIKSSIDHIRACDPALARHLARCIKTGLTCRYDPAPHETRIWSL
jgi:non-specific serine/threonine protein kinase